MEGEGEGEGDRERGRERELGLSRQRVDALYMYGLKRFKLCIWRQYIYNHKFRLLYLGS